MSLRWTSVMVWRIIDDNLGSTDVKFPNDIIFLHQVHLCPKIAMQAGHFWKGIFKYLLQHTSQTVQCWLYNMCSHVSNF